MIVLGLLLILVAVGAAVVLAMAPSATSQVIDLSVLNVKASPLAVFIAGALSVILLGLGLALISRGTRRSARKRKELKELRKENAIAATRDTADREKANADDGTREGANNDTRTTTGTSTGSELRPETAADTGGADPVNESAETPPER
jgi:hypothetical protein